MYRLKIGQLNLPRIYVVEANESAQARSMGIPYIIKPKGWTDDKLIKAVLLNTLMKKFPDIKWNKVLGLYHHDSFISNASTTIKVPANHRENTGHSTATDDYLIKTDDDEYRGTSGGDLNDVPDYTGMSIDDCIGDRLYDISIEELQALKMLPVFMDDIAQAVKVNMLNTAWMDGYNKKLGYNAGNYKGGTQAPNLIVLDVSGSIPSGVAGTMVSLIDTIRSQTNADLIITGSRSYYYANGEKLPSPDELRYYIGGCNECIQFNEILRKHVLGKHWGNFIVFGDQDRPDAYRFSKYHDKWLRKNELSHTRIDNIMAFHTYNTILPGYGLWAKEACPAAPVKADCKWVECMRKD